MRNAGRVVTRTELLEHLWEFHFDPRTSQLRFIEHRRSVPAIATQATYLLCTSLTIEACSAPPESEHAPDHLSLQVFFATNSRIPRPQMGFSRGGFGLSAG